MASPVYLGLHFSSYIGGETTQQLGWCLPAYSSSSSATSTWLCRKAALDGSISDAGTSSVLPWGWGPPIAV